MQVFRLASGLDDDRNQIVRGAPEFMARVRRTSNSAAAGKVVWLVQRNHEIGGAGVLPLFIWMPIVLVALTFLFVLLFARREATIETQRERNLAT